jgi:hypothetical protein
MGELSFNATLAADLLLRFSEALVPSLAKKRTTVAALILVARPIDEADPRTACG